MQSDIYITSLVKLLISPIFVLAQGLPILFGVFLCGCTLQSINPDAALTQSSTTDEIKENLLLDVGIGIFHPGIVENAKPGPGVYPEIRRAESRYLPIQLARVLQSTALWGAVRVVPNRLSEMDIWIDGEILKSDGNKLILEITVKDSAGKLWLKKKYEQPFANNSREAFEDSELIPFNDIYPAISKDLREIYFRTFMVDSKYIRNVTELKFAQKFSADLFADFLITDKSGQDRITRLPLKNSVDWDRVMKIRLREKLFIDVLQKDYENFATRMEPFYREWLWENYRESLMLRSVKEESNNQIVSGILKIFSSLNPLSSDRFGGNSMGPVGFAAGREKLQAGLAQRREAMVHLAGLRELGESLSSGIQPHILNLEQRTFKLIGTVKEQYAA